MTVRTPVTSSTPRSATAASSPRTTTTGCGSTHAVSTRRAAPSCRRLSTRCTTSGIRSQPGRASWRTIFVVPAASDFDANIATTPSLILNCNPASRFRVPRCLIARLTTLRFQVTQSKNREALQVIAIFDGQSLRIFVSLGLYAEPHNHGPKEPPVLWANVHIKYLTSVDTFVYDCSEDYFDSESWATLSKDFGDAELKVRLSFVPSARMSESVLEIRLELFDRVFEDMLQEAAISFPSLADLERDRPRLAPSNSIAPIRPRTFGQIVSPSSRSASPMSSRSPSPASTTSSHVPSSRIRRTTAPHGLDAYVSTRPEGTRHYNGPPELELEEDQVAQGQEEAVPPPQVSTSSPLPLTSPCPRFESPGERSASSPGRLPDPQRHGQGFTKGYQKN